MFVLLALGSRGDVQPMAHLARVLTVNQRPAAVVALAEYAPLVASLAPEATFVPVAASLSTAIGRGPVEDVLGSTLLGQYALLRRWTASVSGAFADALLGVARPGDTIVTGVLTRGAAIACVAGLGCSMASIVYTGQLPTRRRESYMAPQYLTGIEAVDRWGTNTSWQLATSLGSALTERVRRRLGLPHAGWRRVSGLADEHPLVVAASPLLVPTADDWPRGTVRAGYLAPPVQPFDPPSPVADFLRREPVFVGFGSFTQFMGQRDLAALVAASRMTGRALITPTPPGHRPGMIGPDVLAIGAMPYDWLFSQVAATIHHGGSGTSHEALRSGRPTAVIPFGADQPYHAGRLHDLGLGPRPGRLHRRGLTEDELARLIRGLTDGPRAAGHRRRAAVLGEQARAEDGLSALVRLLG